jgi:hypothetical protein
VKFVFNAKWYMKFDSTKGHVNFYLWY